MQFPSQQIELFDLRFDVGQFFVREGAHFVARVLRVAAHFQQAGDFVEGEIHRLGAEDEFQRREMTGTVTAQARGGARHVTEQADFLVVAQRVGAQPGQGGDFADAVRPAIANRSLGLISRH